MVKTKFNVTVFNRKNEYYATVEGMELLRHVVPEIERLDEFLRFEVADYFDLDEDSIEFVFFEVEDPEK